MRVPHTSRGSGGGLSLQVVTEQGAALRFDAGRVIVYEGPVSRNVSINPGATEIIDLPVGTYSVALEALLGSEVEAFGERQGVVVTQDNVTRVTVSLRSFVPALSAVPLEADEAQGFTLEWSSVTGATTYVVEWATDPDFGAAQSDETTSTSLFFSLAPGTYYFRVRAVNRFGSSGLSTSSAQVTFNPAGIVWAEIHAGRSHTCGLDESGQAFCWGLDNRGQVGNGLPEEDVSEPTAVGDGPLGAFSAISSGGSHVCALAVLGGVSCWGNDNFGQLGDGLPEENQPEPGIVAHSLGFVAVSGGGAHTCGLDGSGQAFCWGFDRHGRLGDGLPEEDQPEPVAVSGGHTFVALTAGIGHACGLDESGNAFCWGFDFAGRLGGGFPEEDQPEPVAVSGGHTFVALTAGGHTCGLDDSGRAFCWGWDRDGQLGDGAELVDQAEPVAVSGGHRFVTLTVGHFHTCGIDQLGNALCWGLDQFGQLGDGPELVNQPEPVRVVDP